jgi:hypothetical protein
MMFVHNDPRFASLGSPVSATSIATSAPNRQPMLPAQMSSDSLRARSRRAAVLSVTAAYWLLPLPGCLDDAGIADRVAARNRRG